MDAKMGSVNSAAIAANSYDPFSKANLDRILSAIFLSPSSVSIKCRWYIRSSPNALTVMNRVVSYGIVASTTVSSRHAGKAARLSEPKNR
jgi:hypothetical protein